MTRRVQLRSLAKINLDLRVLYKRSDGFHELRTVFQTISLADRIGIEYEPARKTSLEIDDALNIPDNLVLRAARAVLDATRTTGRVRFTLQKNIPMGGGLGGGSSNAAAVLLALPVLTGKNLSLGELTKIGSQLGSDVPFFLTGGTAVAVDRGTEAYPLADIAEEPMLVVSSGLHVATGPAYQALARPVWPVVEAHGPENRGQTALFLDSGSGSGGSSAAKKGVSPRFSSATAADSGVSGPSSGGSMRLTSRDLSRKINSFKSFVQALVESRSARTASAFSANDFERVVFGQHPQLKTLLGKLRKSAGVQRGEGGARMTGSGSALFALFGSQAERDLAGQVLEGQKVFQGCRIMPAALVSRRSYQRLWRKQLAEHLSPQNEGIWPPPSRYAR
jgi:4-diphosphocytidyl-2C-methyl-D-erythritol kinase